MLGHTGVGKTTYMASLYETMQQSVDGFHLKTSKPRDHSRLLALAQMIRSGNYPPPTAQRHEYEFTLRYQDQDKLSFTWTDYRGGALVEKQSSDQANLLVQDLKKANGIMMFCDCNALTKGSRKAIQLGRMTSLLSRSIQESEQPTTLAIVFTKADLITEFDDSLLIPFNSLIDIVNANKKILGAFIPISCGLQPINIPMPLLFTLHAAVVLKASFSAYQARNHYDKARLLIGKSQGIRGFFRWLLDKWNGNLTDLQIAESQMLKATNQYREFESIKEPAEELSKYVKKLPHIDSKKTLNTYIYELARIHSGIQINRTYSDSSITSTDPFDPFDPFK